MILKNKHTTEIQHISMKSRINYYLVGLVLLQISCGNPDQLEKKKAELEEYKDEMQELKVKIETLEGEITQLDPGFGKSNRQTTIVSTAPIEVRDFEHFIEVGGEVASRQNVVLAAEVTGMVQRIHVREGNEVRRGDILLSLDASTSQRTIAELETALELATTVYERQSNLWEQQIGTEIQYLEAKNRKESVERQLESAQVQLSKSIIRAPFSGSVDEVIIKVGETAMPGSELLRLVGSDKIFVEADVSETYVGSFSKGDKVELIIPSTGEVYTSQLTSVGGVINKENRTFKVEVMLPEAIKAKVKPNQLAVVKISNFVKKDAVVIPTNLIQYDNRGAYVYVVNQADSAFTAQKVYVEGGITYNNQTLIEEGLTGEELLIDKGFRNVSDGFEVKLAEINAQ